MKASVLLFLFFIGPYYLKAQTLPVPSASDTSATESKPLDKTTYSQKQKKKNVKNKAYVMQSQLYVRDVERMEEGYTALAGGSYTIKDFLAKGAVNLVCITYGMALGSGNINSGESSKRYYLQKEGETYREVFLTRKSDGLSGASKMLLTGGGQTYRGMLNTKKSSGSMIEVSKAVLMDMMDEDKEVALKIASLKKITVATLKSLVKSYNATRNQIEKSEPHKKE